VLENAGFADAFGHGPRRLIGPRRQGGLAQQRIAHIGQRLARPIGNSRPAGWGKQGERTVVLMRIKRLTGIGCWRHAFDVGHIERATPRSQASAPGYQPVGAKPRNAKLPGLKAMTPTAFCEPLRQTAISARLVKSQGVGAGAKEVARILPRANRFDHFVRLGVNHTQGVAGGVGHHHAFAAGRNGQSGSMLANKNFSHDCCLQRLSITVTEPSLAM
jgi:hypothetical protein